MEDKIESELRNYNFLLKLEKLKNYNSDILKPTKDTELAEFIHENFDKLDDNSKKDILVKCLKPNEIDMILLRFELMNYDKKCKVELSLDEFEKKAIETINKYHWKGGGHKIEDNEWIIHKHDSEFYTVRTNELLFENTLDVSDLHDEETEHFMKHLVRQLNSLSTNIEVEYRNKDRRSKTTKLLIWSKNINATNSESDSDEVIGL